MSTPEEVLAAAWPLLAHYDLKEIGWLHGRTGVAIHAGDGGTGALVYTLSENLADVEEYIGRVRTGYKSRKVPGHRA